jgi:hypothetical protein
MREIMAGGRFADGVSEYRKGKEKEKERRDTISGN